MKHGIQPDRWEATLLAAMLAVVGSIFLFGKLGVLVQTGIAAISALPHSAPGLLFLVALIVLLAGSSNPDSRVSGGGVERPDHE